MPSKIDARIRVVTARAKIEIAIKRVTTSEILAIVFNVTGLSRKTTRLIRACGRRYWIFAQKDKGVICVVERI